MLEEVLDRVVPERDRDRVLIDAQTPIYMQIDPLRIERVVANLVDNAIKYAPAPSHIVVRLTSTRAGAASSIMRTWSSGRPMLSAIRPAMRAMRSR